MNGLFLISGLASVALGALFDALPVAHTGDHFPPRRNLDQCFGDMVWKTCGTACPKVCGEEEFEVCMDVCTVGCQCPDDTWLLNEETGTCVSSKLDCPVPITQPVARPITKSSVGGVEGLTLFDRNKVFVTCQGDLRWQTCMSSCPLECGKPKAEVCDKKCNIGCGCPKGLWLSGTNECVRYDECYPVTPVCDGDLRWRTCMSSCPRICGQKEPEVCDLECNSGCGCKEGEWRLGSKCLTDDFKCRPASDYLSSVMPVYAAVDQSCPGDLSWQTCMSSCPLVCGENRPDLCDTMCRVGCGCQKGYWRLWNDKCVRKCDVKGSHPPRCLGNTVWNECGTSCPKVCGKPEAEVCDKKCNPGCECPSNWWRNGNSNWCVPAEKWCSTTMLAVVPEIAVDPFMANVAVKPVVWNCDGDMVWKECGTACPKVCGQPESTGGCIAVCKAECQCPAGMWRVGNTNKCVTKNQCEPPQPKCYGDLVWDNCGTSCPKVCGKPWSGICNYKCNAACRCPHGMWRVGNTNKCVTEDKCEAKPDCHGNMVWTDCGTSCPKQCGLPEPTVCDKKCNAECQCPPGLWKVQGSSWCVRKGHWLCPAVDYNHYPYGTHLAAPASPFFTDFAVDGCGSRDTGGTCNRDSCYSWRGDTICVSGKCMCMIGYYAVTPGYDTGYCQKCP